MGVEGGVGGGREGVGERGGCGRRVERKREKEKRGD